MAKGIRVPWVQWRRFRVTGLVREAETGHPLAGLRVQAFDEDLRKDDFLGECTTDADGRFKILFRDADFQDFVELRPDLYLRLKSADGEVLLDTSCEVRQNASEDEYFELTVPRRHSSSVD